LKFNIQIVCIFSIVRIESAYVINEPSVITVRITIVAKIIMSIINLINALPTLTLFIYCEKIYYVLQKNEPNKCNISIQFEISNNYFEKSLDCKKKYLINLHPKTDMI
jgi:hypothetical protein